MPANSHRDPLFPERPQGYGFRSQILATRAAREALGGKAKTGRTFILLIDDGAWGWLGASSHEYTSKHLMMFPIQ